MEKSLKVLNQFNFTILHCIKFKINLSNKINEQLDVFNIITKLNEIDKMKDILLTNS